jgi:cell division protein FtsW (lipid II flippase)
MQLRLDRELALRQICWTLFGLPIMFAISLLLRDLGSLVRMKMPLLVSCLALQGGLFLAGEERNGAALWYALGPLSFQPVELVKVLVVCLLALELSSHQGFTRPVLARLGLGWLALEALLVLQKDLGPALLFFGLFLSMLYVVSGRLSWVFGLLSLSSLGALAAYIGFGHVRVRVEAWLDPLASYQDSGYQLSEALFALAWGGWRGTGLGLGEPWRIPEAATDFIYVAWCEELGSCGGCLLWASLVLFLLRTFHCALACTGNLERLLALGFASLLSWQTTIVLFGTLRLMPMTGLTLPFISYGGSSLLSNFVVLALLQRMSQRNV